MPRYKLIDFGSMRKTSKNPTEKDYDITSIESLIEKQTTRAMTLADIKARADVADAAEKMAADEMAAKKFELQRKFEIIQKYYPELRKRYRFMVTHYISEYLNTMCLQKKSVRTSYISPEKSYSYHERVTYPSATFDFESVKDFNACKKELEKLAELKLDEKSLMATYSSDEVQRLYEGATNYETEFRKKIQDIQTNILDISEFLSMYSTEVSSSGYDYKDSLDSHYKTLQNIFKFKDQEGGQIRYKSKSKSKNKRRTRTRTKSKSKNKRRTRTRTKSKSKSKTKRRTRRK
jgi:hypothetical protein